MKKGKLLKLRSRGMSCWRKKKCHVNMLYKRARNYGMKSYERFNILLYKERNDESLRVL